MDELLDRSMKGIVQYTEYTVTVEEEIFTKNQGHMVARSSSGKLVYNPHGPSLGLLKHSYICLGSTKNILPLP